jgi:Tfp pilus assembly protein PilO
MNKNIVIGLLAIISIVSISFGLYQKQRADENELKAQQNQQLAKEMMDKAAEHQRLAEEQRMIAEMYRMEAIKQRDIAQQALATKKGTK